MAISHVKSVTVVDFTGTVTVYNSAGATTTAAATDLVRPADWNSVHNQFYTLSGNTSNGSTASGTNVVFGASGALTLVGSTGSLIFSAPLASTLDMVPYFGAATNSVALGNATSAPISIWPVTLPQAMSAGVIDLMFSASFSTLGNSSGQQTMGLRAGLFTRGAGANSTLLSALTTWSVQYQVTGNNSSYTISQPVSTGYGGYTLSTTASAASDISSAYTGLKKIGLPVNSYLAPGQYWFAMMGTNSTSSIICGISLSYWGAIINSQATALAPIGSYSSAFSTGSNPVGGRWGDGYGQWSSAGSVTALPASFAFASISASANSVVPFMRVWST